MSKIEITGLESLKRVNSKNLIPIQGDLKDLSGDNYAKLKNSLLKYGFYIPFFVYIDSGKYMLLDGTQRLRVITKENWHQDYPYVQIVAANIEEAKEKLLHITSQYGKITIEGLDTFLPYWQDLDVAFQGLPELKQIPEEKPPQTEDLQDKSIACPECGFEFTKESV